MASTSDALQRLGQLVARRRAVLRLDVLPAARLADISTKTWRNVEQGHSVRATTYTGIEIALEWEIGSCHAVLAGGDPKPLDNEAGVDPAPERVVSADDYEVWVPVPVDELRDAVRGAALASLPNATGAEIQALERSIEMELIARRERRKRESS
jgi:hypothetical protein